MSDHPIEDLRLGEKFRESMKLRADGWIFGGPIWHGWVIMDSFLAGLDEGRKQCAKIADDEEVMTESPESARRIAKAIRQRGKS